MNIHSILVFLHVLAAMGIFMVLAVEALALGRLRRAHTPADARTWMSVLGGVARFAPTAMLTLLATGIWLTARWWHHQWWIDAALAGVVAMAVTGGAMSGRAMRRLGAALAAESGTELSPAFRSPQSSPVIAASLRLRAALAVGIVALMTVKPALAASIFILAAAIVTGLLASLRPGRARVAGTIESGARRIEHELEY